MYSLSHTLSLTHVLKQTHTLSCTISQTPSPPPTLSRVTPVESELKRPLLGVGGGGRIQAGGALGSTLCRAWGGDG